MIIKGHRYGPAKVVALEQSELLSQKYFGILKNCKKCDQPYKFIHTVVMKIFN